MKKIVACFILFVAILSCNMSYAQQTKISNMHIVKRSETIFGIARVYGITVEDLIKANPEMSTPGYELKKGDYIAIPAIQKKNNSTSNTKPNETTIKDTNNKSLKPKYTIKAGVVLPLHDMDGDGRRMIEYYRGILMACEDLKQDGLNIEISAYNTPNDGDIYQTLAMKNLAKCDVIFGPLYTKQVSPLADFCKSNDIKLVIPFSISGNDVQTNKNIFQIYQSPEYFYGRVIEQFVKRYLNYNVVVIDCNDRNSDKGVFTFGLRRKLTEKNIPCSITNVTSSHETFIKAFSETKPNIVVLNTGRSPELNQVIAKLDEVCAANPAIVVSLFGYTEWLMYTKYIANKLCQYDTYIPTTAFYNTYSAKTKAFESKYHSVFNCDMMDYLPKFAITGYDHAMFFFKGLAEKGDKFTGNIETANVLQTPLHFVLTKKNGGMQNNSLMFIHYNRDNKVSIINF